MASNESAVTMPLLSRAEDSVTRSLFIVLRAAFILLVQQAKLPHMVVCSIHQVLGPTLQQQLQNSHMQTVSSTMQWTPALHRHCFRSGQVQWSMSPSAFSDSSVAYPGWHTDRLGNNATQSILHTYCLQYCERFIEKLIHEGIPCMWSWYQMTKVRHAEAVASPPGTTQAVQHNVALCRPAKAAEQR